ncbi:MAG: response regulator [Desulfobacteraceae bacterium]|nr:response regulator [Desulfobacteraceae bacterium]
MMKQILVVDNHPVMLKFMSGFLEKMGYTVKTAADGLSAIEMLSSFTPDIVFIDLVMPNISGEKLCQIIRSRQDLKNCFIVVLSAIMAEEGPAFESCNADVFIAKGPFDRLSTHVESVLETLEQGDAAELKGSVLGRRELFEREITKELLESKKHYETTLNHMSEGLLELVDNSIIVFANPAAISILGLPEEKLLSSALAGLFDEPAKTLINLKLGECAASEKETELDELIEIQSRLLSVKIIAVTGGNTRTTNLVMIRDVTREKQLEAQLQRAKKMEAVGTLAGGVAHDLNNVLSAIVTYPDLLLPQLPEDSPLRKPIQTMRDSGNKAVAIVQDLLTLARRGVPAKMAVNVNRIVSEFLNSAEFLKMKSYHPEVTVTTNLDYELPELSGSPVHLSKTIMNLVSNAMEAIKNKGEVTILTQNNRLDESVAGYETIPPGNYVKIEVSDTGSGISAKDLERVFEPFYTKKKMGRSGTGLGMSVVWGTVKDHDGYIDISSRENLGTTIALYFPVYQQGPEAETKATGFDTQEIKGGGESVLIVDDVKEQREIAYTLLSSLGYQVDAAHSGEAALARIKEKKFDLVLLDMIMDPGMDGLQTYQKILEINPRQKAILISGFTETPRIRQIEKLGVTRFLKKPYTVKTLGMAVKSELTEKKGD